MSMLLLRAEALSPGVTVPASKPSSKPWSELQLLYGQRLFSGLLLFPLWPVAKMTVIVTQLPFCGFCSRNTIFSPFLVLDLHHKRFLQKLRLQPVNFSWLQLHSVSFSGLAFVPLFNSTWPAFTFYHRMEIHRIPLFRNRPTEAVLGHTG